MEVNQYREEVPIQQVIEELLVDADDAIKFDCADRRVTFAVMGWFVFPKNVLVKNKVKSAS